jgi:aldose 1-epimerase
MKTEAGMPVEKLVRVSRNDRSRGQSPKRSRDSLRFLAGNVAPLTGLVLLLLSPSTQSAEPGATVRVFGHLSNGEEVVLITLRNRSGMEVSVMSWGATLLDVRVPDRQGKLDNVNLRLNSLEDYLAGHPMLGSTVGRFANRIDTGGFTIEGTRYDLGSVDPKTKVHIHGGKTGFHSQNWKLGKTWEEKGVSGFVLNLRSPDGHEGYPGNVDATARFSLDEENRLKLSYEATTDRATHVNLTNHSYWNLGGAKSGTILGHILQLGASQVLEFDSRKVPTGKQFPVAGTPVDFRQPHPVGERIGQLPPGYDACFTLDADREKTPGFAARLEDPVSGRVMEIHTTAPGIQLYTANHLSPKLQYEGHSYAPQEGICLECQHFPDTPNHANFPSTLLLPGQVYRAEIVHRFSVKKE